MRKGYKPRWIVFLLLISALLLMTVGSITQMNAFEKKTATINLTQKEEKAIVFYRDDCPDCQSVFPLLYYHNLVKNDLVFVNMNQPANRHYIQTYNLKSVPTIVKKDHQYSGTNKNEIRQMIGDIF